MKHKNFFIVPNQIFVAIRRLKRTREISREKKKDI